MVLKDIVLILACRLLVIFTATGRTVVKKYIVEHHREDILIDLASKEFSPFSPTLKVIRIDFLNRKKRLVSAFKTNARQNGPSLLSKHQ